MVCTLNDIYKQYNKLHEHWYTKISSLRCVEDRNPPQNASYLYMKYWSYAEHCRPCTRLSGVNWWKQNKKKINKYSDFYVLCYIRNFRQTEGWAHAIPCFLSYAKQNPQVWLILKLMIRDTVRPALSAQHKRPHNVTGLETLFNRNLGYVRNNSQMFSLNVDRLHIVYCQPNLKSNIDVRIVCSVGLLRPPYF